MIAAMGIFLTGCGVRGTGEMVTRDIEVTAFTGIRISGSHSVKFSYADEVSLTVIMQENLFDHLLIDVENGELYVRSRRSFITTAVNRPRLYIAAPSLTAIRLSGSTEIVSSDVIQADNFSIRTSGSASITLMLEIAQVLELETSGSSDIDLDVQAERINIQSSGSSKFALNGSANVIDWHTSGAARIDAFELQTKTATVRVSGSANVDVAVVHALTVNISGSGRVRYIGTPHVTQSVSGSGSVSRYAP